MILLTATETHSNLITLSERIVNSLGKLSSQGVSDYTIKGKSLFFRLKFIYIMMGVLGSLRTCWLLDPVFQPDTSITQSLETFGGSLETTVKELTMSQHSYAQSASSTEQHLLEISLLIGSLADCNPHFTNGLAHFINTHGTPLSDISLNDFIQLISRYHTIVNTSTSQKMEGIS